MAVCLEERLTGSRQRAAQHNGLACVACAGLAEGLGLPTRNHKHVAVAPSCNGCTHAHNSGRAVVRCTHRCTCNVRPSPASADFGDGDGHGTHVAAIGVGACMRTANSSASSSGGQQPQQQLDGSSSSSSSSSYALDDAIGMAPGAKLAFYDIADRDGNYVIPPSYEELLQRQLDSGVRVQSDSWGSKL